MPHSSTMHCDQFRSRSRWWRSTKSSSRGATTLESTRDDGRRRPELSVPGSNARTSAAMSSGSGANERTTGAKRSCAAGIVPFPVGSRLLPPGPVAANGPCKQRSSASNMNTGWPATTLRTSAMRPMGMPQTLLCMACSTCSWESTKRIPWGVGGAVGSDSMAWGLAWVSL